MTQIQDELVTLAAERRLIPFIGAGFSSSLGLPSWESMLREVATAAVGALPFDEVMRSTNEDLLQVAEYFFLHHDKQIGPLRREIERSFSSHKPEPMSSASHIELANLGAAQIYTTNYDDNLEVIHRQLDLPFNPVILPKDVALADPDKTQIVKYHGDLAHERTLVLTESAYYKRLDFESPMDLKFRSDLLGKSVLFMGYSFRDVNVRIIWFKLMDMMRDIPEADRRQSYIVRFEPNEALEKLNTAVGLKTIVLDPAGSADTDAKKAALLSEFLMNLSLRADTTARTHVGRSGQHERVIFVSQALLHVVNDRLDGFPGLGDPIRTRRYGYMMPDDAITTRLLTGKIPPPLQKQWEESIAKMLPFLDFTGQLAEALGRIQNVQVVVDYIFDVLRAAGEERVREDKRSLLKLDLKWTSIWQAAISFPKIESLIRDFAVEIRYQATQDADEDIAYLAYLATHFANGQLNVAAVDDESRGYLDELRAGAATLVGEATKIYPTIAMLNNMPLGKPLVAVVLEEVEQHSGDAFHETAVNLDLVEEISSRYGRRESRPSNHYVLREPRPYRGKQRRK